MKKIILSFVMTFLIFSNSALADSFDYSSPGACIQAMTNYAEKALDLSTKYEFGSPEFQHYVNMRNFFLGFAYANSSERTCVNGTCTFLAKAGCDFAFHTSNPPWTSLIVPVLVKETDYLNNGQYDPTLTRTSSFFIQCVYPESSKFDWNNCNIAQKN